MPTECNPELFDFARADGRAVVASFDGGAITSDAGALLLGATDRVLGLTRRLAACFKDSRDPAYTEHALETLVMQRVVGIALGYEDLNDHDQLRHDPVLATLAGKLAATREDCAPLAGKSTLNRLELSRDEPTRYARIAADSAAIEALFVDLFLDAHAKAPAQITLDLDATDDPLHGEQEGRFFHGYYDCYCYLPLYIFCGRHLLAAKLRRSNIDGAAGAVEEVARIVSQIRARWPRVRILLRADSGFCREELMAWCEAKRVDYVFGLARNPRFIVTSLPAAEIDARRLYERVYCARGEMENRIKECQLDLFADRTSAATMRANQLRLWFASFAYVLLCALRRIGLAFTQFARASCGSIRLKLLKIGALVKISVRRIHVAMASACPSQHEFALAHALLRRAGA